MKIRWCGRRPKSGCCTWGCRRGRRCWRRRARMTRRSLPASEILLAMPWHRSDDPPLVREILSDYGRRDEPHRIETLARLLAQLDRDVSTPVLLRLLVEDPSDDVSWQIVGMLRPLLDRRMTLAIRQLQPPNALLGPRARRACVARPRPRKGNPLSAPCGRNRKRQADVRRRTTRLRVRRARRRRRCRETFRSGRRSASRPGGADRPEPRCVSLSGLRAVCLARAIRSARWLCLGPGAVR